MIVVVAPQFLIPLAVLALVATPFVLVGYLVLTNLSTFVGLAIAICVSSALLFLARGVRRPAVAYAGIPAVALTTVLALLTFDPGYHRQITVPAQRWIFERTGMAFGAFAGTVDGVLNHATSTMRSCSPSDDETLSTDVARRCSQIFGSADVAALLGGLETARTDGDTKTALAIVETATGEPALRSIDPVTYPDFTTWWKGDAGRYCPTDLTGAKPADVLVYCRGAEPAKADEFCAARRYDPSWYRDSFMSALCTTPDVEAQARSASTTFASCRLGTCTATRIEDAALRGF